MSHNICHFEIPAEDMERAKEFYGQLFGWTFERYGDGDMEYWMIQTGEGGPDGGLMKRQAPEQGITDYVLVESVDDHARRASELGAQVIVPKMPVPGMGWFCHLLDPEGNVIALWQGDESAPAAAEPAGAQAGQPAGAQ